MDAERDADARRSRTVAWSDPRPLAEAGRGMPGLDFLRAIAAGALPPPPIIALMGIDGLAAEPGRVSMRMATGEYLFNPLGTVHGGALATLLDSVMGCAVHSVLPPGRGYTTLEIKVNYLRAVTEASGPLTAVGQVIHAGRRQAVAEGRLTDAADRLCATASTTCLVFDVPSDASGARAGGGGA